MTMTNSDSRAILAYNIGCKLAMLSSADELSIAMLKSTTPKTIDSSSTVLDAESDRASGDSWGNKVELTLPSNMSVPSR